MIPDLFCHEGHEGMQQAQGYIKYPRQGFSGLRLRIVVFELLLGDLHIPVGKVVPDELIDLPSRLAILEVLEKTFGIADQLLEPGPDPAIGESPGGGWLTIDRLRSTVFKRIEGIHH